MHHYVLMIIQNVEKFMHLYKGILPQVKQFVIDEFKVFLQWWLALTLFHVYYPIIMNGPTKIHALTT